jgi:hypothetical protein
LLCLQHRRNHSAPGHGRETAETAGTYAIQGALSHGTVRQFHAKYNLFKQANYFVAVLLPNNHWKAPLTGYRHFWFLKNTVKNTVRKAMLETDLHCCAK